MLSSALTFEEDLWAKTEIEDGESSLQTAVHNWCIPKVEPTSPSPSNSDENASICDQMTSPIFFSVPYKLKDPVVVLERCDKIWETIKLIKNVQCDRTKKIIQGSCNIESTARKTKIPSGTAESRPYIKYQPVLGNDNTKLPNFTFSVKSTKKVHQCTSCGKLYLDLRSFKAHSEKVHGVYALSNRPKDEKPEDPFIHPKIPKKSRPYSIVNNANINTVEVSKKPTKAAESTAETQTRESTHLTESSTNDKHIVAEDTRLVCILCNKRLKDMKRHLTDYHKFGCTDIMLKELEKSLSCEVQASKDQKSNVTNSDNIESSKKRKDVNTHELPTAKKLKTADQEPSTRPKRNLRISNAHSDGRHKADNNSNVKNRSESPHIQDMPVTKKCECDICHMMYAPSSIYKHKKRHYMSGHTKENFLPNNAKRRSAPSTMASIEQPKSITVNNNKKKVDSKASESKSESVNISSPANNNSLETVEMQKDELSELSCSCGRSFRHLNTFALHKQKCKIEANKTDELDLVDNSFDRDSGIGINITIKKKNDSYEIVAKDESDKNKSTDVIESKDNVTVSDTSDFVLEDHSNVQLKDEQPNQQLNELETSKYSTNHSILKLEFVDEDIDVDIEDDSQNNEENNKQENETIIPVIKEKAIRRSKRARNKRKPFSFTYLCRGLFPNYRRVTDRNASYRRTGVKKRMYCSICGAEYKTPAALNQHVACAHTISQTCAYCKEIFRNYSEYHSHRCHIMEGGVFTAPKSPQKCSICDEVVSTTHELDIHTIDKHYDPMLLSQCHKCPKRFSTILARNRHIRKAHRGETCTTCRQTFKMSLIEKHCGYHNGLGFPCHICKVTYPSNRSQKRHIETKHESTAFELIECPDCLEKVKRKSFEGHRRQHKVSATCKLCDKTFHNYANFLHHVIRFHNAIHPFSRDRFLKKKRTGN